MSREEGNLDTEGKLCGPELQDAAGSPALPCWHQGFWPLKAQAARSVVPRSRNPTRKLTTPRPPNKDPAPGPQGTGPAGFGQICSTGARSKHQGSPRVALGREAEARGAQKGTRWQCTSDPLLAEPMAQRKSGPG